MEIFQLDRLDLSRSGISLSYQVWNKDSHSKEHTHDCIEIVYVVSGSGVNCVGQTRYPIVTNDVYIIRKDMQHSFDTNSELRFFNLMFNLSLFTPLELKYFRENQTFRLFFEADVKDQCEYRFGKIQLSPVDGDSLRNRFVLLREELLGVRRGKRLAAKALLTLLIFELCQGYENFPKNNEFNFSQPDTAQHNLNRILEYVHLHYCERISLSQVADAVNLNSNYLSDFFRIHFGIPLVKYINSLRLDHACRLLKNNRKYNISQVAELCGFADSSYFSRYFQKTLGCTPSKFRGLSNEKTTVSRKN